MCKTNKNIQRQNINLYQAKNINTKDILKPYIAEKLFKFAAADNH